jgi:hypothetical protein
MRRTPQGIRALVRCYCTLVLPIFFGPHYARLRSSLGIVYALFLALVARPRRRRLCEAPARSGQRAASPRRLSAGLRERE